MPVMKISMTQGEEDRLDGQTTEKARNVIINID